MRVLIISTTKFELDGITNVILNYFRAMDKTDMQIDFLIPNEIRKDLKSELEAYGSRIFKLSGRIRYPIIYLKNLTNIIKSNKYHIVHAHGNSCTLALEMLAAKIGGAKVRIPHSHNSTSEHKVIHKLLRKVFDMSYTHGFACGEKAGEWLFKGKPFEVMNNGINIDKFKYDNSIRDEYRDKYNLTEKKVIGHIGHFSYQKNHNFLVDIFAELYQLDNSYRLVLIGDGKLRTDIEMKVNELGLSNSVIFTGKTLETPQLLQAMDMIVMPSRYEGLPLTLVEAQAASLPCFVSDAVSKETEITGLLDFVSLDKHPSHWANLINIRYFPKRSQGTIEHLSKISNAGYSINENAKIQKEYYKQYIEQGNK
jgi:glycosyltransferase involved in cell wall biosynthesis